jgi:hypothetical protein
MSDEPLSVKRILYAIGLFSESDLGKMSETMASSIQTLDDIEVREIELMSFTHKLSEAHHKSLKQKYPHHNFSVNHVTDMYETILGKKSVKMQLDVYRPGEKREDCFNRIREVIVDSYPVGRAVVWMFSECVSVKHHAKTMDDPTSPAYQIVSEAMARAEKEGLDGFDARREWLKQTVSD